MNGPKMKRTSAKLVTFLTLLQMLPASAELDFSHEVLPVLKEHCAECHTNGKYKGSLSIDTREALLDSETVVVGNAAESLFIELLTAHDPDDRMPQKADPLSEEKIAILTKWVNEGLVWEPGFTFKKKTWKAPLAPRKPDLPPARHPGENPVDRIARAYLTANQITPPETISDATFLRRVHLDLIGLLPTPEELRSFTSSTSNEKRSDKITELLGRNIDYADHWMTFWNDLLRNDYAGTGFIDGGRKQITGWLYQALHDNKPYDEFVRELINPKPDSEGFIKGIKWRGNVNASQVQEIQFAQNVSQVFFGENLKCASCHDSFIDDWKLEDAYGMAAIIAGKPLEMYRCDKPTGEFADAKFLFDSLGSIDESAPQEEQLKRAAELSTDKANGRLARTIVNRLWARLMGRGLVEPVDMMSNRPWSEDMLDYLAWDLAENGYDLKRTLAMITSSRTYQSAIAAPPKDAASYQFEGPIAKRMTAEQIIDAVWIITGTSPEKIDAEVMRGKSMPDQTPPGSWIWNEKGNRPAGEKVVFSKEFDLPEASAAKLIITCDNEYLLTINGKEIGGDSNWENVEAFDVSRFLRKGRNTIRIDATNLGGGPNAAALYACLKLESDRESLTFASDSSWLADGKPAVELGPEPWGSRVNSQISEHLSRIDSTTPKVRASLVNSTLLMRALGRPNREQIVTTRPDDLTTLQALELNNGAEFVDYLNRGSSELITLKNGLIDHLYLTALSRPANASEQTVAREILGTLPTTESVADLLWTVLMLPEFQIVN